MESEQPRASEGANAAPGHGGPSFSEPVAALHRRIDETQYENIYVVGDVHGCIDELRTLWDRISPGEDELVVFVGDLVRKGPASTAVVEFVASRDNALSVRGNNEVKLLEESVDTEPFEPILETVEAFPLVVSWGDSMVVHGGVHPEWGLPAHDPTELLEMRSVPRGNSYDGPFWFEQYTGQPRVFFGHTVLADPYTSEAAIGLDTGCVYGGALTAYDCKREQLLSVPAEQSYQQRRDEKILSV